MRVSEHCERYLLKQDGLNSSATLTGLDTTENVADLRVQDVGVGNGGERQRVGLEKRAVTRRDSRGVDGLLAQHGGHDALVAIKVSLLDLVEAVAGGGSEAAADGHGGNLARLVQSREGGSEVGVTHAAVVQDHQGILASAKNGSGELFVGVVGASGHGEAERPQRILKNEGASVGLSVVVVVDDEEITIVGKGTEVGHLEVLGLASLQQRENGILSVLRAT